MDEIRKQVAVARRRLWLELFLHRLLRCLFATLVIAVVAIAVPKIFVVEQLPAAWPWYCLLAGVGAGLLLALLWTALWGKSEFDAAVEIDHRFGLNDRIASSLALSEQDAASPAGRALLADAQRAAKRVDVGERFRISWGTRPWLPLIPAVLAFVLIGLIGNRPAQSQVDPQSQLTKEQRDNAAKQLRERLAERRKMAENNGLKDAEGMFRELEKQAEEMASSDDVDRKRTLVKMNDLSKQLERRRQDLGNRQELRKQFENLNDLNRGPADKMANAMKEGKWDNAIEELNKLKDKLANEQLTDQEKDQLEKQVEQLREKIEQAAETRQQAMENLKKQIEEQKRDGNLARAGELQEKLDQLRQQDQKLQGLNKLAQQMGQMQQAIKNGDQQAAQAAMEQMLEQMEQMQQEMAESEMIDAAMDQLEMAKDALACQQCQGMGCQACGAMGNQFGQQQGNGMGAGRGSGPRPDEENDVQFRDSRVRTKPGRGSAVVVGEAEGPNIQGQVSEAIKEEMALEGSEPADPQVIEQLPKSRREHAEEYFNMLREGR